MNCNDISITFLSNANLQKDLKDVSTEKVNLASQLADAVSERQVGTMSDGSSEAVIKF